MTQAATFEAGSRDGLFDVFTACPLCGCADYQVLTVHEECGNLVRCRRCELTFVRSRRTPSMPEMRQQRPEPLPDMVLQKQDSQTGDFLDILDRIKRYQPAGTLLELGCITGHFLALAREAGYDGIGIEPDPWSAAYARREFGLRVHETTVPELRFEDRSFDVIAMFHVMEHLTRPMDTLLDLRRILRDTGVLAVEIPVIDTLVPMAMGRRHRHYVFDHTLFFSRRKAVEFLNKAGFEVMHSELTGRRIRLERLAWAQRKRTESLGRLLERTFKALGIEKRSIHVNLRDNFRLYCRKAA